MLLPSYWLVTCVIVVLSPTTSIMILMVTGPRSMSPHCLPSLHLYPPSSSQYLSATHTLVHLAWLCFESLIECQNLSHSFALSHLSSSCFLALSYAFLVTFSQIFCQTYYSCSIAWCVGSCLKSRPRHWDSWLIYLYNCSCLVVDNSSAKHAKKSHRKKDSKGSRCKLIHVQLNSY